QEQALVAGAIGDEFDVGCDIAIALDQTSDRRRKAGCKAPRRQHCDFLPGHRSSFSVRIVSMMAGCLAQNPMKGNGAATLSALRDGAVSSKFRAMRCHRFMRAIKIVSSPVARAWFILLSPQLSGQDRSM